MDGDRKINMIMSEGVPLNSAGAANIFLNTGRTSKSNSQDKTVIHLKTEKPADLGVHINTTLSVASSKKIKFLFILNFLLSVVCMVICCSIAFYYWNELISMRRQLDTLREQMIIQNFQSVQDKAVNSPLVGHLMPKLPEMDSRVPRMETFDNKQGSRKYFVEDLGPDVLFVDSKKKELERDKVSLQEIVSTQKELLVAQFNGGLRETNIGSKSIIGPWVLDTEVSSKNSETKIELNTNYVTIKESGLYLVYAQIVYLTHAPNCFFMWAKQPHQEPRLISTCATGDDSSNRALDKSQISCSIQTVTRLHKGDIVNMSQREQNRTLWLRPGYSYFGFVKLSS